MEEIGLLNLIDLTCNTRRISLAIADEHFSPTKHRVMYTKFFFDATNFDTCFAFVSMHAVGYLTTELVFIC